MSHFKAAKKINAVHKLVLTGTPIENSVADLWSIMDFLNPGYLGSPGGFRKKFAVPIEKYRDDAKSIQLRSLVRPFVLRRLKSDPKVVGDLPPKVESREYCYLTNEQAELYEQTVKKMLSDVDATEGIRRRGIVLSALVKLKQICNHPAQALKEGVKGQTTPPSAARSGKTTRLIEMLDEILEELHRIRERTLELQQDSGRVISPMAPLRSTSRRSRMLRREQLLRRVDYLLGWSYYYRAWLSDDVLSAERAEEFFASLLELEPGLLSPQYVSRDLRSRELVAWSILGMAASRGMTAGSSAWWNSSPFLTCLWATFPVFVGFFS